MVDELLHLDKDIIKGISEDNSSSLRILYARHYPIVLNFILNNNGDEKDAKQIFQEGVIILVRNIKSGFFGEENSLKTLIYSVCRRQWLKELENRSPFVVNINDKLGFIEFDDDTKKRIDEEEERFEIIDKSLQELGQPGATICKMYYARKKNLKEIAAEIGYTSIENANRQKTKFITKLSKLYHQNKRF